jgi:transcriptional regulator with XRE-family HTH domain
MYTSNNILKMQTLLCFSTDSRLYVLLTLMKHGVNIGLYWTQITSKSMEPTLDEKFILIGQLLRTRRKILGLDQHAASKRFGVSQAAYSAWENARSHADSDNLHKIAIFLGYSRLSELWAVLEASVDGEQYQASQVAQAQKIIDNLPIKDLANIGVEISRKIAAHASQLC